MSRKYNLALYVTAQWDVHSGSPCIAGTRIPTFIIANCFAAGESIEKIAGNYRITDEEVEAGLRYEYLRSRKRQPKFRALRPEAKS